MEAFCEKTELNYHPLELLEDGQVGGAVGVGGVGGARSRRRVVVVVALGLRADAEARVVVALEVLGRGHAIANWERRDLSTGEHERGRRNSIGQWVTWKDQRVTEGSSPAAMASGGPARRGGGAPMCAAGPPRTDDAAAPEVAEARRWRCLVNE